MATTSSRILPPDFSDEDLLTLLETARLALERQRLFGQVAEILDLSEDYLHELANRLAKFMAAEDTLPSGLGRIAQDCPGGTPKCP